MHKSSADTPLMQPRRNPSWSDAIRQQVR